MITLLLLSTVAAAWDPPEHHHLLPFGPEASEAILANWERSEGWWVSEPRAHEGGGTRVGAIAYAPGPHALAVEARGLDGGHAGPWMPLEERWRNDEGHRVLVLELGRSWPQAELRLGDPAGLASIDWELRVPVNEPRGEPVLEPPSVSAALQAIGVTSRESWGAASTTCTTPETDWYRMAIHHTAGSQTSGGTVQGAVQALQSYAMSSGEYCDIPYQFLVGHDGSLWEGRPLSYYSGATGGGNNDGNIATSFLGCYHSTCSVGPHAVTDAMMAWERVLIHTLAAEHGFAVNSDTVRGHQDWPDNYTACPGDYVMARFGELLSAGSYYQASFVDQSFPALHEGSLSVPLGGAVAGWFELRNDGMETWEPGATFLAPTPRDQASAFAAGDWVSTTRAATVDATTPPGQTGRFTFSLAGSAVGSSTQTFGLVQESVTWFADLPYGGGPSDSYLAVSVEVYEPSDTQAPPQDSEPTPQDSGEPADDPEVDPDGYQPPGVRHQGIEPQGCGCSAAEPPRRPWAVALLLLGLLRRRRR